MYHFIYRIRNKILQLFKKWRNKKNTKLNNKTTLFVGLFDKNTKRQEINDQKAMNIVNNILLQYTEGATAYMGNGIYKHLDNTVIIEPNIIIILYDVDNIVMNKIIVDIKQQLNQECIMKERTDVQVAFI